MEDNQKKLILVVEDEEKLLRVITSKLDTRGYASLKFKSATEAIDYLSGEEKLPDAIWLDYYLPDMDGLEFMQKIKDSERWKKIPVVVVSNSASEQKVNAMLALGVREYLLKAHYKLEDIVDIVESLIKPHE